MQKTKAFIFGLDGGTWDLLDPLIDEGQLPTFAELRKSSASAFTSTTWPAHTGPGWASFSNACMPGQHGVFQFFDTQEPAYRARITTTRDYGRQSCWQWITNKGLSAGLVNIPMSHPAVPLPGYQVTWPLKQTTSYCSPSSLLGDLARNGCYFRSDLATMYRGDLDYIEHAVNFVPERMRAARYLLQNWDADIFQIVLTEADRVCHHYWQFSDPTHPLYTTDVPAHYTTAITTILKLIDAELGETLKVLPDDCSIVVVSDHGFGPGHRSLAANAVLERAGYLKTTAAAQALPDTASWFTENGKTIDWENTRVYQPVPGSYGLNLNLRGRQAKGIVDNSDADQVLQEVTEVFKAICIPETGKPAFLKILRREEAFPGPMMDHAPDLLLIPADERLMVTPSISDEWTWSYQTGLHRHEGMWLHRSARTRAGRLPHRIRLIDVLPTLFEDLGFDASEAFQGKPVSEIFSQPAVNAHSWAGNQVETEPVPDAALSASENEYEVAELTERLKAMGYL
jgi:predicted AlkP superfamily phosphohydrolase/phosphomutase